MAPKILYYCAVAAGLAIALFGKPTPIKGQHKELHLINGVAHAPNDSLRILALGHLAAHYFENYEELKGDSVLQIQLLTAEGSRKQHLVLKVLFDNPANQVYCTKNSIWRNRNRSWMQYALEYAQTNHLNDYISLAHCRAAACALEEGDVQNGILSANLAINNSFASTNDSVRVLCAIQLGKAYLMKGNALMAFKAYNNAHDLALHNNYHLLVAEIYRAIAEMYKSLNHPTIAIDYVLRSTDIFAQSGLKDEVAANYITLGNLHPYTIAKAYLLKAEKLSDSIHNKALKLEAQKILFSNIMSQEKPAFTIEFLQQHPDLIQLFNHSGPHYNDWVYGEIFLYGKQPDSARHYFEKAAPYFDKRYTIAQRKDFYSEMANSYYESKKEDIAKAIFFKEKALRLNKQLYGMRDIKTISYELADLYERSGNLEKALQYTRQYDLYKDSLDWLTKEKELALLEISNETKRQQEAAQLLQQKALRQRDLQYLVITFSVISIFVVLLFLGMFRLSKLTIRVMGFISFISFFEFIIMLLDNYIHQITNGQPLKIWLIKIALLSFLLPLHHFLEDRLIRYLLSKKLLEVKPFFYLRQFLSRHKRPPCATPTTIEKPMAEDDEFVP